MLQNITFITKCVGTITIIVWQISMINVSAAAILNEELLGPKFSYDFSPFYDS